jgi:hypothetical protein
MDQPIGLAAAKVKVKLPTQHLLQQQVSIEDAVIGSIQEEHYLGIQ